MKLQDKIIKLRKENGLSQEELAERLDVSRQAISRWERGTVIPDSKNVLELSKIFHVTMDYLLNDAYESDEDLPKVKSVTEDNHILHMNLSLIAIILQGSFLSAVMEPFEAEMPMDTTEVIIKIVPLLATSIWMSRNLKYERNPVQYRRNTKIELAYCCVQASLFLFGYYSEMYTLGRIAMLLVMLLYILVINPKYMNRKFTKKLRL